MDQWLVRNRIVGGSSSTWHGRCASFNEIDFQLRDWVPYSGWPFGIGDLIPYFDRGAKYLGLGADSWFTDDRVWRRIGHQQPKLGLDQDKLLPMFWQFSRDPINRYDTVRFGRHLTAGDLGPNVTLVTNATVLRIRATDSGAAVKSVEFAAAGGRQWSLPASTVVVCAGGIENARLLLCSNDVVAQGLGNTNDLVGRFLMDHPRGPVARFHIKQGKAVLNRYGPFKSHAAGANLYQFGARLSPALQRSEQLPNCAIWVSKHNAPDDPWDALRRFLCGKANVRQDLLTILINNDLIFRGLKQRLLLYRSLTRKLDALFLEAMCEQLPNPSSRITLSDRRDRLGMRVPRIDWRVSEGEARAMRRTTELMVEQLSRIGLEPPVLEDWVRDGAMFPQTVQDIAHPTGTTRMAHDPARGVVDTQCQVHGVSGLFIGGSSVFPTAGHANPTQMIVALALRLADTLKGRTTAVAEIRKGPMVSIQDGAHPEV
jgi:choline dehydrogenase-like flavoprotein